MSLDNNVVGVNEIAMIKRVRFFCGLTSVFFLLSFSVQASTQEACNIDSSVLSGHYEMSTVKKHARARPTYQRVNVEAPFVFWRNKGEVAYQYPDKKITEIWNQQSNGRIRPIRYFDEYQRGIEYQANEVGGDKESREWSEKFQLISNAFKDSMVLEKTSGTGCERLEFYIKKDQHQTYRMAWSPSLALPVEYKEMSVHRTFRMQLVKQVTHSETVNTFFTVRGAYQTTDYADIGDNENDPFLLGMINLGFIEHGASGFYNMNGELMATQPSRHQH